jgi:hypothetical protein
MDFWTRFAIHTVLVAIGLGLFARTLYGRGRALLSARWTDLFDNIPARIQALLVFGFGQKKFLIDKRERSAGWMHFFIFWGFTILGVRVTTAFAQGWFGTEFHLPLLGIDMLGGPYLLLKDLIEVFVLVSIGYALVLIFFLRDVPRAGRTETSTEAVLPPGGFGAALSSQIGVKENTP